MRRVVRRGMSMQTDSSLPAAVLDLAGELGVTPSPSVQQVHLRLLRLTSDAS